MKKVIKASDRGLTFSFKHKKFKIGSFYNYIVVPKSNKIYIIPTKEGLKVSKKKATIENNALIDIRNKKILRFTNKADKLGIQFKENSIVITAFKDGKPYVTTEIASNNYETLTQQIYKIVSLFSGCGMLDYPFHLDPNFEMVYAIDNELDACKSYESNISNHINNGSVCDVKGDEIPQADILIGGCPCKPFSNANRSNTRLENHDDSKLVLEYIRIVKEGNYKVFVMENVPELLTACNGDYFNAIKECLSEYKIEAKVLQDCKFGGYTKRKRVFIVGSKIGDIEFVENIHEIYNTVGAALSLVDSTWFNFEDKTIPKQSTLDKIIHIPQGGNFKNIPEELRGKGVHSNSYRRLELDKPSCTLTNFRKSQILNPTEHRVISVAEALAISGFKKPFSVLGKLSSKQQQVGNGVPFKLGEAIKNTVKRIFFNHELEFYGV